MEPLERTEGSASKPFFTAAMVVLAVGLAFGITGGLQYLIPGLWKGHLSFEKTRPLHVSSVVFWIILSAAGGVMTYLEEHTRKKLYSTPLLRISLALFVLAIVSILISYCLGIFGGREYWEFPPLLALPILLAWVLLIINFVKSVESFRKQPVYVWMWLTGLVFFLFTFLESYLWIFPYFRNNIVNDMTIQWKSYGSMVGSWNMLIYGSSIYLMDKISGDKANGYSRTAFILYFTGLFNLMFNWGHHIYTLPTHPFVQYISYAVSMTELFILGRIIYKWKSSVSMARRFFFRGSYRFLVAADVWILLNLLLAIGMSIPAINVFTHGTHITVAHSMGTTIGINTMLLLAFVVDKCSNQSQSFSLNNKFLKLGFWMSNISLLFFWCALITAGVLKANWQMSIPQIPFSVMMGQLQPYFIVFVAAGTTLTVGLLLVIYPILRTRSLIVSASELTKDHPLIVQG